VQQLRDACEEGTIPGDGGIGSEQAIQMIVQLSCEFDSFELRDHGGYLPDANAVWKY
jgi:hypothetical protein